MAQWGAAVLRFGPFKTIPRKVSELNELTSVVSTDFRRELAWCEALLAAQIDQVLYFIESKTQLERRLLEGSRDGCFRLLNDIEHKCGLSFWLIATRIALLQIFDGIEAQKDYVSELKKSGARHNTNFLAFWWAVRAEEDTVFDRYTLRLTRLLDRAGLTPEVTAYIAYLLAGLMPTPGAEHALLARSNYSSLVDLYQIFVDLLVTAVAEEREIAAPLADSALRLHLAANDPRVGKALVLMGNFIDLRYLRAASIGVRERTLQPSEVSAASQLLSPIDLEEVSAATQVSNAEVSLTGPFLNLIYPLLRQSSERSATGTKSADDLARIGSTFDKLSIGAWCVAKALQARGQDSLNFDALMRLRLINTPDLEPLLAADVPLNNRPGYVAATKAIYGDCKTTLAGEFVSGAIPFDMALKKGLNELFASEIELIRLIRNLRFSEALPIAAKINASLSSSSKITLQAQIACLINLDRIEDALRIAVGWLLDDPSLAMWLPLDDIATAIDKSGRSFNSMIEKPILFDAIAKHVGGDFNSQRAYATEDFINAMGVDRPSKVQLTDLGLEKRKLVHFFSEICTAPVLRLSIAYHTERELDEELISLCRVLTVIDPENLEVYEDRARELVRARSIKDALKELQRSKISIDEDALRSVIKKLLSEDYNRYIALLKAGVAVVDENYRKTLLKAVSSGEIPRSLFDVPENEASALFASIVVTIMTELAYNAEHGLDCYLSLRIRHGTLSGQLRGPAEREHIITRRDATTKEYQANRYWGQRLEPYLAPEYLTEIQRELTAFSSDYDNLIFEFTDQRIQVYGKDKPNGLFRLQISEIAVNTLASDVTVDKPFSHLIEACIDHFWALVDQSLIEIGSFIDRELRASIRDRFDTLDGALQKIPGLHTATLSDAIRRARTETGARLEAMRDWFVLPTPNSSLPFTMRELVDIALTTIKGFKPEFNPSVSLTAEEIPPLTGALHLFSDIFFILFENISLYSGDSIAPSISITANISSDMILVRVTNNVVGNQDIDRIAQSVDLARERIKSGAYLNAVRSEGGTGLPKLAKLIRRDNLPPHLQFGLSEDKATFAVEFGVSVTVIQGEKEAAE